MQTRNFTIALAAMVLAGGFALATTSAANAESVMKECGADWKAAKAAGTTNGEKWADFLKACKAQKAGAAAPAAAAPMAAPAAAPAPMAAPAPAMTPAAAMTPKPKKSSAMTAPAAPAAGEFTAEAEAKAHCPADTVVWVNTKSHKYHFTGNKSYGTTKKGAYMCETDAKTAGNVAAKDEKPK
jgi:hypothetical protein